MNILNIAFNDIKASRKGIPKGNINITNNIKITSLEETNIGASKEKTAMKLGFLYKTDYEPEIGNIELKGEVLLMEEAKEAKKMLDGWKKNKKIEPNTAAEVLNNIMNKCTFEAIFLARELGMPAPIQMPRVRTEQSQQPKK